MSTARLSRSLNEGSTIEIFLLIAPNRIPSGAGAAEYDSPAWSGERSGERQVPAGGETPKRLRASAARSVPGLIFAANGLRS